MVERSLSIPGDVIWTYYSRAKVGIGLKAFIAVSFVIVVSV